MYGISAYPHGQCTHGPANEHTNTIPSKTANQFPTYPPCCAPPRANNRPANPPSTNPPHQSSIGRTKQIKLPCCAPLRAPPPRGASPPTPSGRRRPRSRTAPARSSPWRAPSPATVFGVGGGDGCVCYSLVVRSWGRCCICGTLLGERVDGLLGAMNEMIPPTPNTHQVLGRELVGRAEVGHEGALPVPHQHRARPCVVLYMRVFVWLLVIGWLKRGVGRDGLSFVSRPAPTPPKNTVRSPQRGETDRHPYNPRHNHHIPITHAMTVIRHDHHITTTTTTQKNATHRWAPHRPPCRRR